MNKLFINMVLFVVVISLAACTGGDTSTGYEYMPDMYRSPGIETYSEHNIEGFTSIPVEGTISRGYLSTFNFDASLDGYLKAGKESTYPENFSKDDKNLNKGKELYGMMCSHCHGPNGGGDGSVTHAVYSAVPSYADTNQMRRSGSTMSELKEGHIFHAITYGYNAMGPHASQLSEDERWKITYYIQEKLQK
jgi:mono/diheme cytochrome c family protein